MPGILFQGLSRIFKDRGNPEYFSKTVKIWTGLSAKEKSRVFRRCIVDTNKHGADCNGRGGKGREGEGRGGEGRGREGRGGEGRGGEGRGSTQYTWPVKQARRLADQLYLQDLI